MVRIRVLFLFIIIIGCERNSNNSDTKLSIQDTILVQSIVKYGYNRDTIYQQINLGPIVIQALYHNNSPVYFRMFNLKHNYDSLTQEHFFRNSSGVFVGLQNGIFDVIGFKYLSGLTGAHISLDSLGRPKDFSNYIVYGESGNIIDLKEIDKGSIKVFQLSDGIIIDSFIYRK